MRDYEQAAKDLEEIKPYFEEIDGCQYGLWTNGLEFFFLEEEGDQVPGRRRAHRRLAAGRRVHRHARRGLARAAPPRRSRRCCARPSAAATTSSTATRACRRTPPSGSSSTSSSARCTTSGAADRRRFWAGPQEQFTDAGRKEIQKRILPLFEEVKKEYKAIFRGNEEITLSARALAFMVSELAKYDFTRTDVDAKGAAYQEIVGTNLRGDRGQYFTPRGAIRLVVQMLDPKPDERVLDPACGTGGFLVATLAHMMSRFREDGEGPRRAQKAPRSSSRCTLAFGSSPRTSSSAPTSTRSSSARAR